MCPDLTCPEGINTLYDYCECDWPVCTAVACPPGQKKNPMTCQCEGPIEYCNPGFVSDTCQYVPCPSGFESDGYGCEPM